MALREAVPLESAHVETCADDGARACVRGEAVPWRAEPCSGFGCVSGAGGPCKTRTCLARLCARGGDGLWLEQS